MSFIGSKEECLIDIFYGIPSSVPSTSKELETTGAVLSLEEMKKIADFEDVICVGEVMNYRGVIKDNSLEIVKFLEWVKENRPNLVIEGHCPKLTGLELSKFLYLGINGDHTEHTLEEFVDRFENGMFVELQKKSITKELSEYIKDNNLYEQACLVTDDVMPDSFLEGHLNLVVKDAIDSGFGVCEAIYCATMTAAKRMRLYDRGAIAPGKVADMVLLDSLDNFEVLYTFKNGKEIYKKSDKNEYLGAKHRFSTELCNSVKLNNLKREDFILDENLNGKYKFRVIQINDGSTQTKEVYRELEITGGKINLENTDCVLAAIFERYGNGTRGIGLVTGDIIKKGAIATTYAHDSHNLLIVGKEIDDMIIAANDVIQSNGGITIVDNSEILAKTILEVGGIVSARPIDIVGKEVKNIRKEMINLGYCHYNPIMSLCTLALPVSPELKITDKGLIDVKNASVVDLIIEKL
ncbi:MAG: adenine deaminase C-terminal domain-containing protein [Sarcina sp.]